ncbi:MAG: lysozyme family protein [Lachnospiraceae bacterium]|nr:lysozyme family protein [Lachnospiraceae bacterium]MBQ6843234.1 lysozyme family protein [Agathobacter sp.]
MAKEIRTRPSHKDIKLLDRTEAAISHMKEVTVKSKDTIKEAEPSRNESIQEYASNKVTHTVENATAGSVYHVRRSVKTATQKIKEKRRMPETEYGTQGSTTFDEQEIKRTAYKKDIKRKVFRKQSTIGQDDKEYVKIKSRKPYEIKTGNDSIKTIENSRQVVVKTSGTVSGQVEQAKKMSAIATERARQAVKFSAKTIELIAKKAVIVLTSCLKAISAALSNLIASLGAGGGIAALILIIVVLFGGVLCMVGGGNANAALPVSDEVEAYEPLIRHYATEHGISEYVELIKAVMMQESGGRGLDPMQSSEGSFNIRYPREPNGITDPEYSISCGVQELKSCLRAADVESPVDMENIKLCLQGYNYGNGYISWAKRNYGGYTVMNAAEFSDMMAERLGWESYGDKQYVAHVLRYYPFGRVPTGIGNQAIVQLALSQEGNVGGQPYWSWYGFNSRVEWCACFVSWCADQCGYIDAGIIPKFSLCSSGASWFARNGQFQDGSYVPSAGDIIFFDWRGNGDVDHVGIVESVVDGRVYTIEGNSGDRCRRRNYSIGYYEIYGYGTPAY